MTDVHLDWLSATTALDLNSVIDALATRVCIASTKVIRPRNRGYSSALQLFDLSGDSIASVEFGKGAPRTLVISTGAEPNDLVRGALAVADSDSRATRVDSAIDLTGDFDQLAGLVKTAASSPRRGKPIGFQNLIQSDAGSTLYIGSPASAVRVRLYEKGREQRAKGNPRAPLDWVRCEIQWRPPRQLRTRAMVMTPTEIWGASAWTASLASRLLHSTVTHSTIPPENTDFESRYGWLIASGSRTFAEACRRFGVGRVVADLSSGHNSAILSKSSHDVSRETFSFEGGDSIDSDPF